MKIKQHLKKQKMALKTPGKNVYETFSSWRYIFVSITVATIALLLISRLAYLQIIEPEYLTNEADKRSLRVTKSVAHRGNIEDRNGEELAISVPAYAIWADPKRVKAAFAFTQQEWLESVVVNPKTGKETARKKFFYESKKWPALADVLDLELEQLAEILQKPNSRFYYLKRQVNQQVVEYINQLNLTGISEQLESHRFYPTGEINANILGLTDLDSQGIEGIEKSYNNYLQGQSGQKRVRQDRLGNVIDNIEVLKVKKAAGNLQLSIDQRIQAVAYSELKRY
jgi:cell division protein FtsI (penicillin-binding protein 3)